VTRTDAEHLGQRHHDERQIACRTDAGDRRTADVRDEVQIDQK
jgi:hypothetical protein